MFHPFRFAGEPRERKGAAAVEFAIVAPLLFLLILGIIEFARIFMVVQIINNG
ncbi:MAG: TadE/TadG family type IV pilus assembly protein, partial [Planctomycetia bacterium]